MTTTDTSHPPNAWDLADHQLLRLVVNRMHVEDYTELDLIEEVRATFGPACVSLARELWRDTHPEPRQRHLRVIRGGAS